MTIQPLTEQVCEQFYAGGGNANNAPINAPSTVINAFSFWTWWNTLNNYVQSQIAQAVWEYLQTLTPNSG